MIQGSCEYWEQYSKMCGSDWRGVEKAMMQDSFHSAGRHDSEKAMIQDSFQSAGWHGVEKAMMQDSFQSAGRHGIEKAMIQVSCDQKVGSSTARCVVWAALVVHVL